MEKKFNLFYSLYVCTVILLGEIKFIKLSIMSYLKLFHNARVYGNDSDLKNNVSKRVLFGKHLIHNLKITLKYQRKIRL